MKKLKIKYLKTLGAVFRLEKENKTIKYSQLKAIKIN